MTEDKPLIIYVFDGFNTPHAGTEGQFIALLKGIDRDKFDLQIVVLSPSEVLNSLSLDIPISYLKAFSLKNLKNWYELLTCLNKLSSARNVIFHTFFIDSSISVPLINILLRKKVIISRRDLGYWYTPSYLKLLNVTGKFVDRVIANAQAVKNIVNEKEGIKADLIEVIYNGYKFSSDASQTGVVEDSQTVSTKPVELILVANIRPVKRIYDAITALAALNDKNVCLSVAGGGDPSELLLIAAKLNVSDRVRFLGEQTNVLPLLEKADIGLLCSESEGFSNAIIEYQISRLPVVCSAVGGNVEAVEHGVDGFVYPMGDTAALTQNLNVLVNDAGIRKQMGELGFKKATMRHSPNAMVQHTERLYDSVLDTDGMQQKQA